MNTNCRYDSIARRMILCNCSQYSNMNVQSLHETIINPILYYSNIYSTVYLRCSGALPMYAKTCNLDTDPTRLIPGMDYIPHKYHYRNNNNNHPLAKCSYDCKCEMMNKIQTVSFESPTEPLEFVAAVLGTLPGRSILVFCRATLSGG